MSYSYFDHEADIGIVGEGTTLEEAFQDGALAMLNLICEFDGELDHSLEVEMEAEDLESLWIVFLNHILAQMDILNLFFRSCEIRKIRAISGKFVLRGSIKGISRERSVVTCHEVKAATYCRVEVVSQPGRCKVQCVVDI